MAFLILIYLSIIAVMVVALWKLFTKAGQPGWASIIPIYNTIIMIEIAKKPMWWFFMLLIPFVNLYFLVVLYLEIARRFGKDTGFGIGLILLPMIFFPILAFGDATYDSTPSQEV